MEQAHKGGKWVVVWTLNDATEMAEYLSAGADGFYTDDVPLGRAALRAAGFLPQDIGRPSLPGCGGAGEGGEERDCEGPAA
jgi:hypothetical protein